MQNKILMLFFISHFFELFLLFNFLKSKYETTNPNERVLSKSSIVSVSL